MTMELKVTYKAPLMSSRTRKALECLGETMSGPVRRALADCEPNYMFTISQSKFQVTGWALSFSELYEPVALDSMRNITSTIAPYMNPDYDFSCATYYADQHHVAVLAMTKESFAEEREYILQGRNKRDYIFDEHGRPVMYRFDKAQRDIRRVLITYYQSKGFEWNTSIEMGSLINVISEYNWKDCYRLDWQRCQRLPTPYRNGWPKNCASRRWPICLT